MYLRVWTQSLKRTHKQANTHTHTQSLYFNFSPCSIIDEYNKHTVRDFICVRMYLCVFGRLWVWMSILQCSGWRVISHEKAPQVKLDILHVHFCVCMSVCECVCVWPRTRFRVYACSYCIRCWTSLVLFKRSVSLHCNHSDGGRVYCCCCRV